MQKTTRRMVRAGLYLALGVTLHIMETALLPLGMVLPFPGARVGLANLVGLVVLAMEGAGLAWWVTLGRIVLGALFSGTFLGLPFWMGSAGGALAMAGMTAARPLVPDRFSWLGLSVMGAFCHNIGQLLVLKTVVPGVGIMAYLPWMALLSVPSGALVGGAASKVIQRLAAVWDDDCQRNLVEEDDGP